MNQRNILIALTAFIIASVSVLVAVVARGYRLDIKNAKVTATGILVATSDPDGAEVFVNGKLTTATNNTINLSPGKYSVKITKDGFNPWEKTIVIKPEEVFKTSAYLFPSLPELRPLTLTGANNPILSPDGTKIAYLVASASAEKNGLWILDMTRTVLPAGIFSSADTRLIYHLSNFFSLSDTQLSWSPDEKEILASTSAKTSFLLETDRANDVPSDVTSRTTALLSQWHDQDLARYLTQTAKLHPKLYPLLASAAGHLRFSPDENKILYQATASATLPTVLTTYLPGTNPTPQDRDVKAGNFYIYDIKEDKNYLIENCKLKIVNCVWFPTSRHLLLTTDKEISTIEFDGTNKSVIYAGPFEDGFVFPWPDSRKIIILTSLNALSAAGKNLYTINLR